MEKKTKLSDEELDIYGGIDIPLNEDTNPDVFPQNEACSFFDPFDPISNNHKCAECKYFYYPEGTVMMGKCSK